MLFAALPEPAALLIPGGPGAAKAARDPLLQGFLRAHAALTTGTSGSGLLLPGEAGTLDGRVLGGPAELADTLWGFTPADVRPGEVVTDGALCSAPAGFAALHAALHVTSALWGDEAARDAAERLGGSPAGLDQGAARGQFGAQVVRADRADLSGVVPRGPGGGDPGGLAHGVAVLLHADAGLRLEGAARRATRHEQVRDVQRDDGAQRMSWNAPGAKYGAVPSRSCSSFAPPLTEWMSTG